MPLQFTSNLRADISVKIKQLGVGVSDSGLKQGDEVYGLTLTVFTDGSRGFAELALANKDRKHTNPIH